MPLPTSRFVVEGPSPGPRAGDVWTLRVVVGLVSASVGASCVLFLTPGETREELDGSCGRFRSCTIGVFGTHCGPTKEFSKFSEAGPCAGQEWTPVARTHRHWLQPLRDLRAWFWNSDDIVWEDPEYPVRWDFRWLLADTHSDGCVTRSRSGSITSCGDCRGVMECGGWKTTCRPDGSIDQVARSGQDCWVLRRGPGIWRNLLHVSAPPRTPAAPAAAGGIGASDAGTEGPSG